ncbi:MAG: hypothetical protein GX557_10180 [Chloroflexi bacterium]|nr:hypothetical protein [Chloroflexota bacterium]
MNAGIDAATFPYEHYLAVKEQRDHFLDEWARGLRPHEVPVLITPPWDMWNDNTTTDPAEMLRLNLWGMATSAEWQSDWVYQHLDPWYGVGVYATAFGAHYYWDGDSAPQTHPLWRSLDELEAIRTPQVGRSEEMQEVLRRIRWYRALTHDRLPICLTDTQSPQDTASLLMETSEFFAACAAQPERLAPLLDAITDAIIAFSEMQIEAIGPNLALPGHQMICHPAWSGISISDDNMALLSPTAYAATCVPYNSRLARHFGGIALHSCGRVRHNIAAQLRTAGLQQMETAACISARDSDPDPNSPEHLRDGYRGSVVILKVRIHKSEVDLLDRLLAPDLRVALAVTGVETRAESEAVYARFKERSARIAATWRPAAQPA